MRNRTLFVPAAILALVAGAIVWVRLGMSPRVVIDLGAAFPRAEKRTTVPQGEQAFNLEAVRIGGILKRSILAKPASRITWEVTVPEAAMLETAFGMREDSWDRPGADGAQFRIAVSGGTGYDELMRQYVNPGASRSDRRWQTVSLDLSPYAGLPMQIIFSTDPGLPPGTNTAFDFCVWGEPRIIGGR